MAGDMNKTMQTLFNVEFPAVNCCYLYQKERILECDHLCMRDRVLQKFDNDGAGKIHQIETNLNSFRL